MRGGIELLDLVRIGLDNTMASVVIDFILDLYTLTIPVPPIGQVISFLVLLKDLIALIRDYNDLGLSSMPQLDS